MANPEVSSDPESEKLKSREVLTDDVDAIGPTDNVDSLEAIPVGCAVMTASKSDQQVAGMAHISINVEEGPGSLVSQLNLRLQQLGVKLGDCQMRLFNAGDELLLGNLRAGLTFNKANMPSSESIPAEFQGVRINKKTGEVTFFSTFPEPESQ